MKRVIKSSVIASDSDFWNNNEQVVPKPFTFDFLEDQVIPSIKNKISEIYGRRFKNMSVDTDDLAIGGKTGRSFSVVVSIYNNNQLKKQGTFQFSCYSDYWDEADFKQHLSQKINSFVRSL